MSSSIISIRSAMTSKPPSLNRPFLSLNRPFPIRNRPSPLISPPLLPPPMKSPFKIQIPAELRVVRRLDSPVDPSPREKTQEEGGQTVGRVEMARKPREIRGKRGFRNPFPSIRRFPRNPRPFRSPPKPPLKPPPRRRRFPPTVETWKPPRSLRRLRAPHWTRRGLSPRVGHVGRVACVFSFRGSSWSRSRRT